MDDDAQDFHEPDMIQRAKSTGPYAQRAKTIQILNRPDGGFLPDNLVEAFVFVAVDVGLPDPLHGRPVAPPPGSMNFLDKRGDEISPVLLNGVEFFRHSQPSLPPAGLPAIAQQGIHLPGVGEWDTVVELETIGVMIKD